jgi:hypothetical protein
VAITKMDLMNLLRNIEGGDVDLLREGVRVLAQALMEGIDRGSRSRGSAIVCIRTIKSDNHERPGQSPLQSAPTGRVHRPGSFPFWVAGSHHPSGTTVDASGDPHGDRRRGAEVAPPRFAVRALRPQDKAVTRSGILHREDVLATAAAARVAQFDGEAAEQTVQGRAQDR